MELYFLEQAESFFAFITRKQFVALVKWCPMEYKN